MNIKVSEIIEKIEGKIVTENVNIDELTVSDGYVSDLLSDVMGNARDNMIWVTIMRHMNVIAVASLTGVKTVVFTNDIVPDNKVIAKAEEEGICLVTTKLPSFNTAGIIYSLTNQ